MAISSGFNYQKITPIVIGASVLLGGIIEEIPPLGAQLVVEAEQPVLEETITRGAITEEPPPPPELEIARRVIHQAATNLEEPPHSIVRGSLTEEPPPPEPELFGRLVVTAEPIEIPASFTERGVIPDDVNPISGGVDVISQGHSLEQMQAVLVSSLLEEPAAEEPPFGGASIIVQAEITPETPSITLESNLREDISPELYRRIIHEAEPTVIPASVTLPSLPGQEPPSAPLIVQAATSPEQPPESILRGSITPVQDDVPVELSRQIIHTVGPFDETPSFLLGSNLREDIEPELYRRIIHEAESEAIEQPSVTRGSIVEEPPFGPLIEEAGRILWFAEPDELPPASVLLGSNLADDVTPEEPQRGILIVEAEVTPETPSVLRQAIIEVFAGISGISVEAEEEQEAIQAVLRGGITPDDVVPEPPAQSLIVQAEPVPETPSVTLPSIPEEIPPDPIATPLIVSAEPESDAYSIVLGSNLREDISPELYRFIIHQAEPIPDAYSVTLSGITPEAVTPLEPPFGNSVIVTAEPTELGYSITLSGIVPPDAETPPFGGQLIVQAEEIRLDPPHSVVINPNTADEIPQNDQIIVSAEEIRPDAIQSVTLHGVPADEIPRTDRIIVEAEPIPAAHSFTHAGVPAIEEIPPGKSIFAFAEPIPEPHVFVSNQQKLVDIVATLVKIHAQDLFFQDRIEEDVLFQDREESDILFNDREGQDLEF